MSGQARFVYWMESTLDGLPSEPLFEVITNEKGLPNWTVSGDTLLEFYGIPLPLFPSLRTWRREVALKRKCFRCWRTVKGASDFTRHLEVVHGSKFGKVLS